MALAHVPRADLSDNAHYVNLHRTRLPSAVDPQLIRPAEVATA